jgi:hypothetical protein
MPEGRFGRRLRRCVLVALFGATFAIAGVTGVFAAVASSDDGYSTQDFTWGMVRTETDFTWGVARPGTAGDVSSPTAVQLQRDFTWG